MRHTVIVVLLSLLTLSGCVRAAAKVDGKWQDPRPRLTKEERFALVPLSDPVATPDTPLTLRIYPQITLAYVTARLTCVLPKGIQEGRYRFGIEGMFDHQAEINRREYEHVFNVGCFPLRAYCGYQEYKSPLGYQEPKVVTLDIKPVGDCR